MRTKLSTHHVAPSTSSPALWISSNPRVHWLLSRKPALLGFFCCKDYMQEFFLGGCSGDDYAAFIKFNTGSQDKCSVSIKICPFNSYNSISNQLFQLHFFYLIIHSRPTAALKKAVSFTALRKIRLKELTATSSSLNPTNYYFLSIPPISQTNVFLLFFLLQWAVSCICEPLQPERRA